MAKKQKGNEPDSQHSPAISEDNVIESEHPFFDEKIPPAEEPERLWRTKKWQAANPKVDTDLLDRFEKEVTGCINEEDARNYLSELNMQVRTNGETMHYLEELIKRYH